MWSIHAIFFLIVSGPIGEALVRQNMRFLQSNHDVGHPPLAVLPSKELELHDLVSSSTQQSDALHREEMTRRIVDFVDVGAGCCRGPRDEANGRLWQGRAATLADCQAKCRELEDCGAIEFGWTFGRKNRSSAEMCFIWSSKQLCLALDWGALSCGGGGDNGVHAYRVKAVMEKVTLKEKTKTKSRLAEPAPLRESNETIEFKEVGAGCCSGDRISGRGKLWAGETSTLTDCKAKCQQFGNCGAIEYGGDVDKHYCFVWDDQQACLTLEWGDGACGQDVDAWKGGTVRVYKVTNSSGTTSSKRGVHAYEVMNSSYNGTGIPEPREDERWLPNLVLDQNTSLDKSLDFEDGVPGCCSGGRDEASGKLWAGETATLADCKAKCSNFENCKAVEYGWHLADTKWCFIWNEKQSCTSVATGEESCGKGGGNNGVRTYRIKSSSRSSDTPRNSWPLPSLPSAELKANQSPNPQQQVTSQDVMDFLDVGAGCCSGFRDELHGKIWSGETPTLSDCKNKCRSFQQCGAIEYGWTHGNKSEQWCFIWSQQQACMNLDWRPDACGPGGGDNGVHAYRVSRAREVDLSISKLHDDAQQEATLSKKLGFQDGIEGCCGGARDEAHGKLWAGDTATLADCQAKCREFENCGAVEYGWKYTNEQWCFIWSNKQSCTSIDIGEKSCGSGGGKTGVHVYKYKSKAEKPVLRDHLLDRFIVVPEHKLMFCYMENVAAFTFNELFAQLRMRYNSSIFPMKGNVGWFQSAPRNHGYNKTDLESILADEKWHKAIFYEDPVERFVTGYKNKCRQQDDDGALVCSRSFGDEDASFDMAVERMSEMDERPGFDPDLKVNEHFQRQMSYCGGLKHNLKYYNTIEPLQNDTVRSKVINLLSKVGADYKWIPNFDTLFPTSKVHDNLSQNERNTKLLQHVRQFLPPEKPMLFEKLLEHYKGDYKLFNMSPPRWSEVQQPVLKNHLLDRFFIVPEHKLLFCYMEKVACTNFNSLFAQLRRHYNDSFIATHGSFGWFQSVPYLEGYSIRNLEHIMEDPSWHKALFYRDPVERFVSAYRSKCEHVDKDGAFVCNRAFGDKNASFKKAVERISRLDERSDFDPDYTMNVHFQRQMSFCGGLEHNLKYYDTVEPLSVDTARSKVEHLFEKVGAQTEWISDFDKLFPEAEKNGDGVLLQNQKHHNTDSAEHLRDYLPDDRPDLLQKLWRHYEGDYRIFNITPPRWEGKEIRNWLLNSSSHNFYSVEAPWPQVE
mmetsp:Transcript_37686/g.70478  ORF Transcript_37686/g.70478 Transcript_37686/m.70478 type:complete len:1243 (+) Transcript_37686:108-3836(+)